MDQAIVTLAWELFRTDAATTPPTTLRAGNAVDGYQEPPPYDPEIDKPTDEYLEKYCFWGLLYLDPASWRYYLPRLIEYALHRAGNPGSLVIESLLSSLRPPDSEPPRLASLSQEQERLIAAFLEALAFGEESAYRDYAIQVLEE